jgi:hypothetical protein
MHPFQDPGDDAMKTLPRTFDVTLSGHLDAALFDLAAEYGLTEVPAQITLRGLPADAATLQAILDRAYVIGITVTQLRPGIHESDDIG